MAHQYQPLLNTEGQVQGDAPTNTNSGGYAPVTSQPSSYPQVSQPGTPYQPSSPPYQPTSSYQPPPSQPYGQPQAQPYQQGQPVYVAVPQNQYGQPQQGFPPYAQPAYPSQAPQQGGQPGQPRLVGGWSDGICDCFNDCESCCCAFCCPCIRWSQTLSRAALWTFGGAMAFYAICYILNVAFNPNLLPQILDSPWLVAISIVAGVALRVAGMVYRNRIRQKYLIPGGSCEDCLCHFFCTCCAIAQEARHVDRDVGMLPMPIGLEHQQHR